MPSVVVLVFRISYIVFLGHIELNPSHAEGYFRPKHKDVKTFEHHLNPTMLVSFDSSN